MDNENKEASSTSSSNDWEQKIRKQVKEVFSGLSESWVDKLVDLSCKKCEQPANLDNWLAISEITANKFNPGAKHCNDNDNIIRIHHTCTNHSHSVNVYICLEANCKRIVLNRGPSRITHTDECKHSQQKTSKSQQQESQSKEKADDNTQSLYGSDDDDNCGGNFDGDVHADSITSIHDVNDYLDTSFNKQTAAYFKREHHKKGDGNRGLVVCARISRDINSSYETHITDECVARELHNAKMYIKADKSTRDDIAASNRNIVEEGVKEMNELKRKYETSMHEIVEELVAKIDGDILEKKSLTDKASQVVNDKIELLKSWTSSSKDRKIDPITDPNIVRTQITEGPNSIIKNLPLPDVQQLGRFSYIPIKDLVKLTFALGLPIRQYKENKDWLHNEKYEGKYFETLHQKAQTETLPTGTRIIIIRCWSDGFQPFSVKDNNKKFNSLQIVTATLLGKEGQNITWPFALGFKTDDHSDVMDQFRSEAKQLEEPWQVYCGIEKCLIWISVHLQVIMNDYPERCANTYTADNGLFTHRWMYSCRYCHETTPSCEKCRGNRVNRILSDKTAEGIKSKSEEEFNCCGDWHNIDSERTQYYHSSDKYPMTIGDNWPDPPPLVRLNFNILKNAIKDAEQYFQQYFSSEHNKTALKPKKGKAKEFLQACGLQPKLANHVVDLLADNKSIEDLIPQIIAHPNTPMAIFTIIPMHQFFLGVEKKLISIPFISKHLLKSLTRDSKEVCKTIESDIQNSHKCVSGAKINWCHGVPFTSNDGLTTTGWLSENYIAFTRTSLVYFGYIDTTLDKVSCRMTALESFKEMRVLWFCLVAHVFAEDNDGVHSCVIGDYVKLFLSACARFHDETGDSGIQEENWDKVKEDALNFDEKLTRHSEIQRKIDQFRQAIISDGNQVPRFTDTEVRLIGSVRVKKAEINKKKDILSLIGKEPMSIEDYLLDQGHGKHIVMAFLRSDTTLKNNTTEKGSSANEGSRTFFETTANFLSLLNVEEAIEWFGSLRKLWEGNDEKFIQLIKNELSGFRHKDEHMKTLLLKMLRTKIFDIINKDNQFSQRKTYARTIDFKTYDKEKELSNEHFFSGVIIGDEMFMCFNAESGTARSDMPLLTLKNIEFTGAGCWNYNLWYETISIKEGTSKRCSRHEVLEQSSDFFILFPLKNDKKKFTMICKSWKVRDEKGTLRLPTPLESTLTRSDKSDVGRKIPLSEEIASCSGCEPKTKRKKGGDRGS